MALSSKDTLLYLLFYSSFLSVRILRGMARVMIEYSLQLS